MKKVYAESKAVSLTDNNYVARGGQGEVYEKHGIIYKIYHDPTHMIPAGKMNELRILDKPNIMRPISPIYPSKNNNVRLSYTSLAGLKICLCSNRFIPIDLIMSLLNGSSKLENLVRG